MGEKLYKPILKDGDHLVQSKENEGRVRGVSQDSNNKTTDIVEWEEVDIDDYSSEPTYDDYTSERVELTPEQQEMAEMVGAALAAAVIYGAGQLHEHVIKPWWQNSAMPWLKDRVADTKQLFSGKTKAEKVAKEQKKTATKVKKSESTTDIAESVSATHIDDILDKEFENLQFDMSSEEAKTHMMRLIYHMLGTAYEIKILSNARIVKQVEDESTRIEKQKQAEQLLAQKVTSSINELLSDEKLLLDVTTSKQIFGLFGGGIKLNGEYVPVELEKVVTAIDSMEEEKK